MQLKNYSRAGNRTSEQIDHGVTAATHNALNQITALSPTGPIHFEGTVTEPATVTVNGVPAYLDGSNAFSADVTLSPGTPTVAVVATDGSGNTATRHYQVTVDSGTSRTLTYDANGNLTNDGAGKTYDWDAADRLVKITQGSNVTEFVYDGVGQRVQEKLAGSVIKQWVWCDGPQPCEERDASNAVTRRFYAAGEQIGSSAYFFTTDHLGSVREMIDSTGSIRARYDYDPYGRVTKLSGDLEADFGFTGFYRHQASGLALTLYRAYDANLGRWLSRDPVAENGGINRYEYVANDPVGLIDPLGLTGEGEMRLDLTGHGGPHIQQGGARWDARTLEPIPHMGETPTPLNASQLEELRTSGILDKIRKGFPDSRVAETMAEEGITVCKRLPMTQARGLLAKLLRGAGPISEFFFFLDMANQPQGRYYRVLDVDSNGNEIPGKYRSVWIANGSET